MNEQERVARGAALLDEKVPNWRDKIDVDRLEMHSGADCILGQLFRHYVKGAIALGLGENGCTEACVCSLVNETPIEEHGFQAADKQREGEEYNALKQEWLKVLGVETNATE